MSTPIKYSFEDVFSNSGNINNKIKKGYLKGKEITHLVNKVNTSTDVSVKREADGGLKWKVGDQEVDFTAKTPKFNWLDRFIHICKMKFFSSYKAQFNDRINKIDQAYQNIKDESDSESSSGIKSSSLREKHLSTPSKTSTLEAPDPKIAEMEALRKEKADLSKAIADKREELKAQRKESANLEKLVSHMEEKCQDNQVKIQENKDKAAFYNEILPKVEELRDIFVNSWTNLLYSGEQKKLDDLVKILGDEYKGKLSTKKSIVPLYEALVEEQRECARILSDLPALEEADTSAAQNLRFLLGQSEEEVNGIQKAIKGYEVRLAEVNEALGEDQETDFVSEDEAPLILTSSSEDLLEPIVEENSSKEKIEIADLTEEESGISQSAAWASSRFLKDIELEFFFSLSPQEQKLYQILSEENHSTRIANVLVPLLRTKVVSVTELDQGRYELRVNPAKGMVKLGEDGGFWGTSIPIELKDKTILEFKKNRWKILEGGPKLTKGATIDLTGSTFKSEKGFIKVGLNMPFGFGWVAQPLADSGISPDPAMTLKPGFVDWEN